MTTKQQVPIVTKKSPICVRPSSELLHPITPPASTNKAAAAAPLSSFDSCMPPVPITMLLVFDHPITNPTQTIKTALSHALTHYRPIAGRLVGDAAISCTNDGVTFVSASAANSTLEQAMAVLPHTDLAFSYPNPRCHGEDPLLLMQVTEFSCGGFIVAVTWNHLLADAAGMAQFMNAVGELARRGVSPPAPSIVVPVRHWDDSLPGIPSSAIAAQKSTLDYDPLPLSRLDIVVPSTLINLIKSTAGEFAGGEPCATVFEAVAAVLWRCRVRAALSGDDPESPAPLTIPCNVRKLAGAPVGYYGNCVVMLVVPATVGVVANSDIVDLVRMIRRGKEKVAGLLSSSGTGGGDDGGGGVVEGELVAAPVVWYEALAVSSWRNLGMDATDMGGGVPARVTWQPERTMVPACVVCPKRRDGRDGDVDVSAMFVREEHVDAFLGELARLVAESEE